jgi:hypothetical protein
MPISLVFQLNAPLSLRLPFSLKPVRRRKTNPKMVSEWEQIGKNTQCGSRHRWAIRWGEQWYWWANVGEQAKESMDSKRVNTADDIPLQAGEQSGEHSPENSESSESNDSHQLKSATVVEGEGEHWWGEHFAPEGEQKGESKSRVRDDRRVQSAHTPEGKGEQKSEQAAQVILFVGCSPKRGYWHLVSKLRMNNPRNGWKTLLPEASNGSGR